MKFSYSTRLIFAVFCFSGPPVISVNRPKKYRTIKLTIACIDGIVRYPWCCPWWSWARTDIRFHWIAKRWDYVWLNVEREEWERRNGGSGMMNRMMKEERESIKLKGEERWRQKGENNLSMIYINKVECLSFPSSLRHFSHHFPSSDDHDRLLSIKFAPINMPKWNGS